MYHILKPSTPLWKWLAPLILMASLLSSALLQPMPVNAATTIQCDDGGDGINGYTSSSQCARIIRDYQCSHDDAPAGAQDTLTCSQRPEPRTTCKAFTSTARWGGLTTGDLLELAIPIPGAVIPDMAKDPRYRNIPLTNDLAYLQLRGEWCYHDGNVVSIKHTSIRARPTAVATYFIIFTNTRAGQYRQQRLQGQTDYLNETTTTQVYLHFPAGGKFVIPGTAIEIEFPPGTSYPIAYLDLTTRLTGRGNALCSQLGDQAGEKSCTVTTTFLREEY